MIIKLNNKFYKKQVIEQAIIDFKDVCDGSILNQKIEIELKPKERVEFLKEEFCNYVLGLMKNQMLV